MGNNNVFDDGTTTIDSGIITTDTVNCNTATIQTFNYTTATGNSLQGNTIIGNVASFNTINGTFIFKDTVQNIIINTGYSITSGRANTLMGNLCGNSISTGVYNTGYGCSSLKSTTSGSNNTAVGYFSLYSNTASSNTALGIQAGRNNTTGTQNLFLGYFADTTGVFNNSTAIGYNSRITASNQIVLGTTAETTYIAGNAFINGTFQNNTSINTPLLTVGNIQATNSIQATTGGFTTIQGTDGDFTGALNSNSISCNSMTVGAVSSGSITVGTITGSDTVINLTTQLQANNGIDLNGSFLLGGTSITTRDISITGTFSQGNYITSPTESINLYLPTTLNIPTYSIGMVSAYGNNPTCNKGLQIGNNYTGSYTTGLHETDFVNWAGTGVGGFNFYNMNSGGFSSLASISITGNITANGFVGTHYGNISGTTGNFTGTITGGAISCSSLNTNNGAISSGSISCSGLNTNNGAITSGAVSCSSLTTNNGSITAGSGVISGGGLTITAGASVGAFTSSSITNAGLLQTGTFTGVHKPRYDSGWFQVSTNGVYRSGTNFPALPFTYQLDAPPVYKILCSDNSNPTLGSTDITDITGQNINWNANGGYLIQYTNNNTIALFTGGSVACVYVNGSNIVSNFTTGYYRIYLY